uniref:Uncharacterized protein n=1 Tax=Pan paniscus TaxID=9597 RepID=A0A2R9AH59_PANPA
MCPYLSSFPTRVSPNFLFNSHSSAPISMSHNCNFNLLFFFCIFDVFQTLQKLARMLQNSWILFTQVTQTLARYRNCPVTLASLSPTLFFSLIYISFFLLFANKSFHPENQPGSPPVSMCFLRDSQANHLSQVSDGM